MQKSRFASSLTAAVAIAGLGMGMAAPSALEINVGTQVSPHQPKPSQSAPGTQQDVQARRRRFVNAVNPSRQARALRKSTGTHKQNRRRALAGR